METTRGAATGAPGLFSYIQDTDSNRKQIKNNRLFKYLFMAISAYFLVSLLKRLFFKPEGRKSIADDFVTRPGVKGL